MKLSTKGRYAITAMLDLALNANQGNKVTLADISAFQGISLSYLEQLFARLRQARLVAGTRGPGGGYRLARPAQEINIAEIINAIGDTAPKIKAVSMDERHQKSQQLWEQLNHNIRGYLSSITLADLIYGNSMDNTKSATDEHTNPAAIWQNQPHKHDTAL